MGRVSLLFHQMGVRTVNKMVKSKRLTFVDMIANIGRLAAKT